MKAVVLFLRDGVTIYRDMVDGHRVDVASVRVGHPGGHGGGHGGRGNDGRRPRVRHLHVRHQIDLPLLGGAEMTDLDSNEPIGQYLAKNVWPTFIYWGKIVLIE